MNLLCLLVGAAALAACSSARDCNPGPLDFVVCPGEGQICDLSERCVTPRYTVNADGTVTDEVTGLTWQQMLPSNPCPSDGDGGMGCFWPDAQTYCENLNLGAWSSGWRVPTVAELFSLGDANGDAGIDTSAFPNVNSNILWTSDTIAGLGGDAWSIEFVPYNNGVGGPDVVSQTYTPAGQVNDTLDWVLCVH